MKKKIIRLVEKINSDRNFTLGIEVQLEVPYYMSRIELIRYAHILGLLPDNILKRHFVEKI